MGYQAPLAERVPPELAAPLATILARGGVSPDRFAGTETWSAAITLARVDATGYPANGVDRALLADFAGRPVRELEGADSMGCPIREETYIHLVLRVERAFKINSWSENPPARTRRLVGLAGGAHRQAEGSLRQGGAGADS